MPNIVRVWNFADLVFQRGKMPLYMSNTVLIDPKSVKNEEKPDSADEPL